MATASETDPNRYINDPERLNRVIEQYERQGMTAETAIRNLQARGFKIPPGLVPAPAPAPPGPLTLAEPPPAALPPITPAPGEGTPVLPVDVLAEFSQEVQAVATPGSAGPTSTPRSPDLSVKRTEPIAPAAPSGYIPITETTTTTSTQEQDLATLTKLREEELGIATEISDYKVGQAETEATEQLMRVRREKIQEEEFAQKQEERQKLQAARENEVLAAVEAATLEYKNAEIDSGRIWQRKGTGSRILAAIAAGLGAYASAMSGTKNFALEIINNAISDDIEAQKAEIALKGGVITEQRNLLSDLRRKGMSDNEAANAARVIMLKRSETMLQEKLAKSKVESVKQEGALFLKQLKNEHALALETLRLSVAPKKVVTEKETQQPDPALRLSMKAAEAEATAMGRKKGERESEQEFGLSAKEKDARKVPGFIGLANTAAQANQAIQANQDIIKLEQALDELIAMKQEYGYDNAMYSEARNAAKTKSILMVSMLKAKAFLDLGVLQEADMKLLEKAVSMDPLGEFSTDLVLAQYEALKKYVKLARDVTFQSLGLTSETGVPVDVTKADIRDQFRASSAAYN